MSRKNKNEMHPIHILLSKNIIRFRRKLGIKQAELAEKIGLTHNFINDLENGKKGVSSETIRKLCKVLHIEPFQLFMPPDLQKNELQLKINKYMDKLDMLEKELDKLKDYSVFLEKEK